MQNRPDHLNVNLPEDIAVERSIIATIAAPGNTDQALDITHYLEAEDFVIPAHQAVFQAIRMIASTGGELNALTLREALVQTGDMVRVGEFYTLVELLSSTEVGRPRILADILRRKRQLREIMGLAWTLDSRSASQMEDPDAILASAMESMGLIATTLKTDGIWDMTEAAMHLMSGEALCEPRMLQKVVRIGLPAFDNAIEFRPSHVGVIGAGTGVGKSTLMAQGMIETVQFCNVPTLGISLEMDRPEVESRILANVVGLPHPEVLRGKHARHLGKSQMEMMAKLKMYTAQSGSSMGLIETVIRKAVKKFGVKSIWIDYFTLIKPSDARKNSNDAAKFGEISMALKRIAQDLSIHIVILSQFSRKVGAGDEPDLSALRETGQLENDANWVILLWLDKQNQRWGKIAKNRSGSGSMGGMKPTPLSLNGETQQIREEVRETNPPLTNYV